jgi:putative polyhydroxyalkanoate system protein
MSSIEIYTPFTMPKDQLKDELDKLVLRLGEELQLECEWQSDDCLNFKRSGAKGQINIGDEELELTIRLGMLLELFRGTIEQKLHEFIDEHIY